MVLSANVITFPVTDQVVLYAVATVYVTVVFASVTQDGKVNLVTVMLQMKHVLWMVVMRFVRVVVLVNAASVNVTKN